jgi:hypothetical protein
MEAAGIEPAEDSVRRLSSAERALEGGFVDRRAPEQELDRQLERTAELFYEKSMVSSSTPPCVLTLKE